MGVSFAVLGMLAFLLVLIFGGSIIIGEHNKKLGNIIKAKFIYKPNYSSIIIASILQLLLLTPVLLVLYKRGISIQEIIISILPLLLIGSILLPQMREQFTIIMDDQFILGSSQWGFYNRKVRISRTKDIKVIHPKGIFGKVIPFGYIKSTGSERIGIIGLDKDILLLRKELENE